MKRILLPILCLAAAARAQSQCDFYLLDHYDYNNNVGVALFTYASGTGSGNCALDSMSLVLTVGDGTAFSYAGGTPAQQWQLGHMYTVTAVLTAGGPQQLFLDGQFMGSATGAFQPMPGALYASEIPSWASGPADYQVVQTSLQIANGSQTISFPATGSYTLPASPLLMLGGTPTWDGFLVDDPTQTMTITATFQIATPDATPPAQYYPFVDQYGQSNYGTWPSKVNTDADLQAAAAAEQAWLTANPPVSGLDAYGGSTLAGWQGPATGYYCTAYNNNRWWLISPLGNPLFYTSVATMQPNGTEPTPITGREAEFAALPPQTSDYAAAYTTNYWGTSEDQNTTFVYFDVSNWIRKYGPQWAATVAGLETQRLASWGFSGMGKWSAITPGVPITPVLNHAAVPNVVAGGHPDVFDTNVVAQLNATLASQIGSNVTNPYIVGWSVGNEIAEDIEPSEVSDVLALGASTPAKQALVNQALTALYGGSVSTLAAAWSIEAVTVTDIYAATTANPPDADVEALRQFYEQNYYQTIYSTIKQIDPNHLYLGNWIAPGYWVNASDWAIIAANTDVIGFDYYAMEFLSTYDLNALIQSAGVPVMVGEFSFPSNYDGQRGFGSYYTATTESDSESGDYYTLWLQAASAFPYCVGVSWFGYEDMPVSGQGNQSGSSAGSAVVYGLDYAVGLVDITDQPKYDLVNKVRAANQAVFESLGLLGAAAGNAAVAH